MKKRARDAAENVRAERTTTTTMYICMFTHIARVSVDQPGRVAIPARGQLNRESVFFCPVRVRSRLRIWSRDTASAVPSRVSLLISILRLNL